jgi:hypothetical protein
MSDNEHTENAADDTVLTKTKKPRSEAQIAAFEKARAAQAAKLEEKRSGRAPADPDKERKKMILQAVKDKLNGEPKSKTPPVVDETTEEDVSEDETPPPKKAAKKAAVAPPVIKAKKEPKVVYQDESESEEEIVIVKKRKKPKKKTIIIEESETEDEEPAPKKVVAPPPPLPTRETKSQLNKSMFKVTPGKAEPPKPIYYFAD